MISLATALAEVYSDIDLEPKKPDGLTLPQWYLMQTERIEVERARVKKTKEQLISFINGLAIAEQGKLDRAEHWMKSQFGAGFKAEVLKDLRGSKAKSINYLVGRAGTRLKPERVVIESEAVAILGAEHNCPQAVKTTKTLMVSELTKHFKATGEVLAGTTTIGGDDEFFPSIELPELPEGLGDGAKEIRKALPSS